MDDSVMLITLEVGTGTSEILRLPNFTPLSRASNFALRTTQYSINCMREISISFSGYKLHMLNLFARDWFVVPLPNQYRCTVYNQRSSTWEWGEIFVEWCKIIQRMNIENYESIYRINKLLGATKNKNEVSKIIDNLINSFSSAQMIKPCDTSKHYQTMLQEN